MTDRRGDVVVVDDDEEMRQAITRLLRAGGFHVISYPSGEALLDGDGAASAACLILDIHLPGLSGPELYERLRHSGFETPVIFITAYDNQISRAQAQHAGAVAYFTKPFLARPLLTAVAKAMHPG